MLTLVIRKKEVRVQVIHVKSVMLEDLSVAYILVNAYGVLESTQTLATPNIDASIQGHNYMKVFVLSHMIYLLVKGAGALLFDIGL